MTSFRLTLWFGACLLLALASRWQVLEGRSERCAFDGRPMAKTHQVDLVSAGQVTRSFCGVRCAKQWPERPPQATWHVRDEVTGQILDAQLACFVHSGVSAVPGRQDNVRAFKQWSDAMQHVAEYGGARIANPLDTEAKDP